MELTTTHWSFKLNSNICEGMLLVFLLQIMKYVCDVLSSWRELYILLHIDMINWNLRNTPP